MAVEGDQLPEARRFSPLAMALFGLIVPEVVEFTVGLGESAGQGRVKVMGSCGQSMYSPYGATARPCKARQAVAPCDGRCLRFRRAVLGDGRH